MPQKDKFADLNLIYHRSVEKLPGSHLFLKEILRLSEIIAQLGFENLLKTLYLLDRIAS